MKGLDYGITAGLSLKNSGVVWLDLVLVEYLGTLVCTIQLVGIGTNTPLLATVCTSYEGKPLFCHSPRTDFIGYLS